MQNPDFFAYKTLLRLLRFCFFHKSFSLLTVNHIKMLFFDNAITSLTNRAEIGLRPNANCQTVPQEGTIGAKPARLATTNVTDWKLEQKEDPVLYLVVKHGKASQEVFKEALWKVTDRKAVAAYVKSKEQLIMKNGLLYR